MKKTLHPLFVLVALCAAGCGEEAPAVASVEVSPRSLKLPFPELHTVHLSWQTSAPLDGFAGTPTVFVHLLDDNDKVVRTFDHAFPGKWREGTAVGYDLKLYQSALAPSLPGGRYRLTVGLAGEGKQRWVLDGLGEAVARREYLAADVEVPPPPANKKSGPRFTFSEQWQPAEPGGDRQVLARRWLTGEGAMRVAGLRKPGHVWLVLRIPPPEVAGTLHVKDGGMPTVRIEGSCGDFEASLSGPGIHEVEMPLVDPPKSGQCRLELEPNFSFGSPGRSVSLENAAWSPSGGAPRSTGSSGSGPTSPSSP
ncbi:MAG TPA: hypothetical protein VN493_28410 [Thermoanaerobaculia bacterium]|nr:hypothetical protein [Thermoanaerobaculia bacterium]